MKSISVEEGNICLGELTINVALIGHFWDIDG